MVSIWAGKGIIEREPVYLVSGNGLHDWRRRGGFWLFGLFEMIPTAFGAGRMGKGSFLFRKNLLEKTWATPTDFTFWPSGMGSWDGERLGGE